MKILITGLRFDDHLRSDSKEAKQVGKIGTLTGNAYSGFKFIPDNKTHTFETYDLVYFNYKEVNND